jgi:hypothetical protein
VTPPSNVAASWHHTAAVVVAPSSLDDFLSGVHHHRYPFGFTISIPSSNEHEHKISLPAALASEHEQENEGEGSCDESASLVSELTQMTYRAELKKQVSSEIILIMRCAVICSQQPLTPSPFHHR